MKQYPKGGLVGKTLRLFQAIGDMKVPVYAAHASYFIVLAVFPLLVLLLSLLRYTGLDVTTLTQVLEGFLPTALLPAVTKLIINTYYGITGTTLWLSALVALWSASRGIFGLLTGLNSIYGVAEDRGWLYTRTVSVVYTFLFLLMLLLTLVLHVFGTTLLQLLPTDDAPFWRFLTEVVDLRFFLLLGLQTLLFTAMFMVLPNRHNRFFDSLPGALLASSGWLVFSDAFSVYVEKFTQYATIYGSVYVVALSMLWLYCCVSILFYGGALNQYLMKQGY